MTLSISEIDLLNQQIASCWIVPSGAVIKKGTIVKVSLKVRQNRNQDNTIQTNILIGGLRTKIFNYSIYFL